MIQRSSFLPVWRVMDSLGGISLSRWMPLRRPFVVTRENSIANGNPIGPPRPRSSVTTHSAIVKERKDLRRHLYEQPRASLVKRSGSQDIAPLQLSEEKLIR